ncbi:MAG: IS1634 family transposase [bacterium]|nr:IS1634 family transposase [bacterium]
MFFREKRSKHSKLPIVQLVENIHTDRGTRQRIVVSLGTYLKIPKEHRRAVARLVKERLLGQQSLLETEVSLMVYADKVVKKIQTEGKWHSAKALIEKDAPRSAESELPHDSQNGLSVSTASSTLTAEVFVDDVQHGYDRELGPVLLGHEFWKRLHFPSILQACGFKPSQIYTAELSVLNRLIAQDSEHGLLSWLHTVAVEELLEVDVGQFGKDRFYRISDKLLQHQEQIETRLYQREQDLFNLNNSIFLYDLTNSYFEGSGEANPKAEYNGNQKEKRTDCPQVVVALVVDREGFIRRHRMCNGKMTDAKSLKHIISDVQKEFQDAPLPTLVFDRGVGSEENMQLLDSYENLKYVLACRVGEESGFINDFQNQSFCELEGREDQKKSKVEVFLKEQDGMVYLLCKSVGRKAKETAMRNSVETKLDAELTNLSTQIQKGRQNDPVKIERRIGRFKERYSSVAKYFRISYTHWEFSSSVRPNTPDTGPLPKRFAKSLQGVQTKVDNHAISFPALKKKLASLADKYPEAYSRLHIHLKPSKLTWETIDEIEQKARDLDGNYLLKTNRHDLQQHEIWHLYMTLTRMEQAFRDLKTHLGLRPVYHHKEIRVDGHIFISILAYHLLHAIEYTLRQQSCCSRWATIKRVVSTHQYSTIQLPTVGGSVINIRKPGIPEGIHQEIYNKLGVDYTRIPIQKIVT